MTSYEPVRTAAELDTLDLAEIIEGYGDGLDDEPEPQGNRSRAYWHGWRVGMMDKGRLPIDDAHRGLVRDVVARGTIAVAADA